MIQVTPQMRILLAVESVDFRKGIDGLAGVCRSVIGADPFLCGAVQYVAGGARASRVCRPLGGSEPRSECTQGKIFHRKTYIIAGCDPSMPFLMAESIFGDPNRADTSSPKGSVN